MNVALPAIALLVLVLPGILFHYFLRRGYKWKSSVRMRTFAEEAAWGVFFALMIHCFGIWILPKLTDKQFDPAVFVDLLTGAHDSHLVYNKAISSSHPSIAKTSDLASQFMPILRYLIYSNIGAIVLGIFVNYLIPRFQVDVYVSYFRFETLRDYVVDDRLRLFVTRNTYLADFILWLKARVPSQLKWDTKHFKEHNTRTFAFIKWILFKKSPTAAYARLIVEEPGRLVEYMGRLIATEYDRTGEPDTIVLEDVHYLILHEDGRHYRMQDDVAESQMKSAGFVDHYELFDKAFKIRARSGWVCLDQENVISMGVDHREVGLTSDLKDTLRDRHKDISRIAVVHDSLLPVEHG